MFSRRSIPPEWFIIGTGLAFALGVVWFFGMLTGRV